MALYCWTRCAENGIESKYTSENKCFMRLVTLYGWMFIFGPSAMYLSVKVLRHLSNSAKVGQQLQGGQRGAGKMNSKLDAINKAAKNIAIFTACFGLIVTIACIVRIRTSITPNPANEGRASLVEFGTALISPVGVYIFARPSIKFLDCKWRVSLEYYTNSNYGAASSTVDSESERRKKSSNVVSISDSKKSTTNARIEVNSQTSIDVSNSTNQYVVAQ
eukprot:g6054.t1